MFLPLQRIIPNEIEIIDDSTLHIHFDDAVTGIANIAGYIPTISHEYDQVVATNPWPVVHSIGSTKPAAYPDGTVVNYSTPQASPEKAYPEKIEIIDLNRTTATWDANTDGWGRC